MDQADPLTAKGIPCAFAAYLVLREGRWALVEHGVPERLQRIRSVIDRGTLAASSGTFANPVASGGPAPRVEVISPPPNFACLRFRKLFRGSNGCRTVYSRGRRPSSIFMTA
jgi:hypothetical protein